MATESILEGGSPLHAHINTFLLQLAIIICLSRSLGYLLSYVRQPSVIAEVLGGVILGPTVLGRIPGFTATVFPEESIPRLELVAEIGLILYLFLVGIELDPVKIMKDFKKSAAISTAGIVLPFVLGIGVASVIYANYIDPSVSFSSFAVFTGVVMSVTAFPVLARILTERKLMSTNVGQATVAAAAFDDAIAWCLLIVVVALINNPAKSINALYVCLIVVAFSVALWYLIRPLFINLIQNSRAEGGASQFNVFFVFLCMILASWFTQAVGVHSIFGSFLIGLITPHDKGFAIAITEKIEDLVLILFLPMYFALSGLNTHLDDLNDGLSWGIVVLVIAVACGGKILGCAISSKFTGLSWRESMTVGVLMNTRGLVEIIVLNLGLEAGIISSKVYAIFLVMALMTTFMTVPIVSMIYPYSMYIQHDFKPNSHALESQKTLEQEPENGTLVVMICLPNMKTVPAMMTLTQMFLTSNRKLDLYSLRLVELGDRMSKVMMASESANTMESDPVINIFRTFGQLNKIAIKTLLTVSVASKFAIDITEAGSDIGTDLIIFPIEASLKTYPKGWAAQTAKQLWTHAPCPLAFFLDRGFGSTSSLPKLEEEPLSVLEEQEQTVFFAFYGTGDDVEASVVLNYLSHANIKVVIYVLNEPTASSPEYEALDALGTFPNVSIERPESKSTLGLISRATTLGNKDLILIGYQNYESDGQADTFKFWVDSVARASLMVVKKPGEVLARRRLLRGQSDNVITRRTLRPASII